MARWYGRTKEEWWQTFWWWVWPRMLVPRDRAEHWTRGSDVARVQRWLSEVGFPVHADGIYGPRTVRAVRAFRHAIMSQFDDESMFDCVDRRLYRTLKRLAGLYRRDRERARNGSG